MLPEGSEQLKHLDRKISTFDQHQLSWPTEVNNYLLKWNVPVYDQEAIIAINSTHGSDLDIVRKSRENRIHQWEEVQKQASVAIIKAREICQKNWAEYSNQTISIRPGDQNYKDAKLGVMIQKC